MRAVAIHEFGGPEKLKLTEIARPRPEKRELLIRVVAAGVNSVDYQIREGRLKDLLPHHFPLIPGWDVAGVVEELGEGSSSYRKGDRVWAYARKPIVQWGCYAEYVTLPEANVARMPSRLLFEEAAAVPLAGLTAYQCLFGKSAVAPGTTVLIHGAAGGVGHFAVQLAKNAGARVIATAGTANQSFVLSLGAASGIDYTKEDFRDALQRLEPQGADFVLDTVGGETLARSFAVVKPGGRLVSIVERPDLQAAGERGISAYFVFVEPNADQLNELSRMFDGKKLRAQVQKIYPLAQAAEAHRIQETRHVQGKLVLNL